MSDVQSQEVTQKADDFSGLDHVVQQADATGAGAVPVEEGGQLGAPPPVDYQHESRGAVETFAALVGGYCPKAGELWNEAAKIRTAAALAPVMEKYKFTFGNLPPELTFVIVAGPLLYQTSRVVAAQMAVDKAATVKEKKPEAQTMPTGAPDGPGVHPQTALYPS